jgi:hypothetical protein
MAVTRQTSRRTLVLQPTNAEVSTNQVYAPRYEFLVDGELTLPLPRIINSMKHTDVAATIYRVDVSVNKGGTSQYQVTINSYNSSGLDPLTHVDHTFTITQDRERIGIPVILAAMPENRSIECIVTEVNAASPATDMTVTIIMEDFADIKPDRGHRILDLNGVVQPQKEDLQFKGANITEDIVDQRTVVDIGFIGQMINSMLTEAQMQTLYGDGWILSDGRSVINSKYYFITGFTNVPDARGVGLRGKNNGRSDGNQDPEGERALGSFQDDSFESHTHIQDSHNHPQDSHNHPQDPHTHTYYGGTNVLNDSGNFPYPSINPGLNGRTGINEATATNQPVIATNQPATATNQNTGGIETRMKNVATNIFIKIN